MKNTLSLQVGLLACLTFAIIATLHWPEARIPRLYGGPYLGPYADLEASIAAVDMQGVTRSAEPGLRDYLYRRATWLPDPVRLVFARPTRNHDFRIRAGRDRGSACGTYDSHPAGETDDALDGLGRFGFINGTWKYMAFQRRRTSFASDGHHIRTDGEFDRSREDVARFGHVWESVCGPPAYAPHLTEQERSVQQEDDPFAAAKTFPPWPGGLPRSSMLNAGSFRLAPPRVSKRARCKRKDAMDFLLSMRCGEFGSGSHGAAGLFGKGAAGVAGSSTIYGYRP